MHKFLLLIYFFFSGSMVVLSQGDFTQFTVSGNSKFFGYCLKLKNAEVDEEVARKNWGTKKIYEFRYFSIADQKPILKFQFYSPHFNETKITTSFDGKTIAITSRWVTYVVNAQSKSVVYESRAYSSSGYAEGFSDIHFPHLDNSFVKVQKGGMGSYNTFTGKLIRGFEKSTYSTGCGQVWFSEDDKYLIQKKSPRKFNLWRYDGRKRIASVSGTAFGFDYINQTVTFIDRLKIRTYSLKNMTLLSAKDMKNDVREFSKQKKTDDPRGQIKFQDGILSKSGNFVIIPFSIEKENGLLLCSTQRDESKEISVSELKEVKEMQWLNDSILVLNHYNNTTTFLNLYDLANPKTLDLGYSKRKYIKNKNLKVSDDFDLYVKSKKGMFSSGFEFVDLKHSTNFSSPDKEFVSFTPNSNYMIAYDSKKKKYGVINLAEYKKGEPSLKLFGDTIPLIHESEIEDDDIPDDYEPHRIKEFKHISELKDTSALINLVLKNVEFTDSTISLNTHLIDENGVYYYGAGSEEWKHIWCNLLLKKGGGKLNQITDFEIIEHRENMFLPYATTIVMDHSGSMGNRRTEKLQNEADNFIQLKSKNDALSLIKFDNKIGVEAYPTKNQIDLLAALQKDGIKGYGGGTAIVDATNAAISILDNTYGYLKNSIILLTDGYENSSFANKNKVVQRAIDNNMNVFIIGYGKRVDDEYLKSITNHTYGCYYKIYRKKDFEWIFTDIRNKVRNYYEIKFKSDTITNHKASLKVCITNKHTDTITVSIDNTPFREKSRKNKKSGSSFSTIDDENQVNDLSNHPNIKSFDGIHASQLNIDTSTTTVSAPDTIIQKIESEFEQLTLPDIKFHHNKTTIIESSLKGIDEVIQFLKRNKEVIIEVAGHTDSDGEDGFNLELSQTRATKIKSILVVRGIHESRIKAKGYGELFPVLPNTSEQNKQKNRRVEFNIIDSK